MDSWDYFEERRIYYAQVRNGILYSRKCSLECGVSNQTEDHYISQKLANNVRYIDKIMNDSIFHTYNQEDPFDNVVDLVLRASECAGLHYKEQDEIVSTVSIEYVKSIQFFKNFSYSDCKRTGRIVIHTTHGKFPYAATKVETINISNEIPSFEHIKLRIESTLVLATTTGIKTCRLPKTTKVKFVKGSGAVLLHEAIGHSLEYRRDNDFSYQLPWHLGDLVCDKSVSVVDIPQRLWKFSKYDDEGNDLTTNNLIIDGVFVGYLESNHNRVHNHDSKTSSGRRANFRYRPSPRMTCTVIKSKQGIDDVFTNDLMILCSSCGPAVRVPNTDYYLVNVPHSEVVHGGETVDYVSNLVLRGRCSSFLSQIDAIGKRPETLVASCIGSSGHIQVMYSAPDLLLDQLEVYRV